MEISELLGAARTAMKPLILGPLVATVFGAAMLAQHEDHQHSYSGSEEGLGRAHMDTSCSTEVAAQFDRALALLHNFWYVRASERFNQIAKNDPECAMAYWGAAMTYNHPFWDPPSQADETAAWALVQEGLRPRETLSRCRRRSLQRRWRWDHISARSTLPRRDGGRLRQISG